MTKYRILGIVFSLLLVVGLNSCEDDDIGSTGSAIIGPGTVYTRINTNGGVSAFDTALKLADGNIQDVLNGTGPFTVLAPSNASFSTFANELGYEDTDESSATDKLFAAIDTGVLAQIINTHIISANLDSSGFTDGSSVGTVSGDDLLVSIDGDGAILFQDATKTPETNPVAKITEANSLADNGVVHFIDKVLLPQSAVDDLNFDTRPTVADFATGSEDLSILAEALTITNLTDTFVAIDTARVLAPNNQAFEDLFTALGDDYSSIQDFDNDVEIVLLSEILKYHVIPPVDASTDLIAGTTVTWLEGNTIEVAAAGTDFSFEDTTAAIANTITADLDAKNGVVDIIDKVLLPQSYMDFEALLLSDDLATIVNNTPDLSTLLEALIATELEEEFIDASNVADSTATNFTYAKTATVLAPTNDAFNDLFNTLGADYTGIASFDTEDELALLTEILLYHVIEGKVESTDLEAGMVTTVSGSDIEIISVLGSEDFVIGDKTNNINANITTADIIARNGISHVIDKVLLPKAAIDFINTL